MVDNQKNTNFLSVKKNIDQGSDTSNLVPETLDSYNLKWEEWLVE